MSDHDDTTPEPDFGDPALDALRALLADARATEPVPADVAARLDATLAALREERLAEAGVVPLRRRRTAARILVAAAAVVVVGAGAVGVARIAEDGSGGSSGSTAADSAKSDSTGGASSNSPAAPEALSGARSPTPTGTAGGRASQAAALPQFSTTRFARQAAAFDPTTGTFEADKSLDSRADTARSPAASDAPNDTQGRTATSCPGPSLPDTTSVPILLDGHAAVLVLHPVVDGTQQVDAWSCDGSTEFTTATVTR